MNNQFPILYVNEIKVLYARQKESKYLQLLIMASYTLEITNYLKCVKDYAFK